MSKKKIKRVYELEKHDVFVWRCVEYKVKIIADKIYFRRCNHAERCYSFGLFNQMRVEFLYNAKTHDHFR